MANFYLSYLAAWGAADKADGGDKAKTEQFMTQFLKNVEVFDTGGRGCDITQLAHMSQRNPGSQAVLLFLGHGGKHPSFQRAGSDRVYRNIPWGQAIAQIHGNSIDRKSTRLNSSHSQQSRMPSSA